MRQPVQTYRGRLDESHCQKYEESARGFSHAWMKLDRFSDREEKNGLRSIASIRARASMLPALFMTSQI
jgi:hypothetical protein